MISISPISQYWAKIISKSLHHIGHSMPQQINNEPISVSVRNIGGIESCEVEFESPVTILTGNNTTNRTSLLTAVGSALGGTTGSLKADAKRGEVTLQVGDKTFNRQLIRENGEVNLDGNPFTEDETLADMFACLLESNPVRQAVERGDNLREILMQPVNIDELQAQIRDIEKERRELEERLSTIERQRERLPTLKNQRSSLEKDLNAIEEELATIRQEIEKYEADQEEANTAKEVVDLHQETQAELATVQQEFETQQQSLEALYDEREDAQTGLEEIEGDVSEELQEIDTELEKLRERKRNLADAISDLSTIVEFNEELVDTESGVDDVLGPFESDDATAQLNPMSETIECWTCGSSIERQEIAERIDEFRNVIEERRGDRKAAQERIDELNKRKEKLEEQSTKQAQLEQRLEEIETEIQDRLDRIDELEEQEAELKEQVKHFEQRIAETEDLRDSGLLEKYQAVSELEYERGQIEQELVETQEELEQIEELTDERTQLEEQQEELQRELTSLRTRIEDLEQNIVEIFNARMEDILDLLEYENLERVWIERKADSSGTRAGMPDSTFDLHVVRATAEDTVYEDTVDHLSESEREVIGLIVALAGYVAHDVHETVPVVLLDSVEALDASRIARLIEYIADLVPYLFVALLPEDAAALDGEYNHLPADDIQS